MNAISFPISSIANILRVSALGAVCAGACHGKYDHFEPIVIDTCPGPCSGCDGDDEKYTCHLTVRNESQTVVSNWTGETCAPPNLHPTEVPLTSAVSCVVQCEAELAMQQLTDGHVAFRT